MARFTFSKEVVEWKSILYRQAKKEITVQDSLTQLKPFIEKEGKNVNFLGRYLGLLFNAKDLLELPTIVDKINDADAESSLPLIFKGLVNFELNLAKEANEFLNQLKTVKKQFTPTEQRYFSLLLKKAGSKQEAIQSYQKYLATDEERIDIEAAFEKMHLDNEVGNFIDILNISKSYLERDPNNIELRFFRALGLRGTGDSEKAIVEFTVLIQETEDTHKKAILYLERAKCRPISDVKEKIKDLKECHKLEPKIGADKEILVSYYAANLMQEAEDYMKTLEKVYDFESSFHLAIIKGGILRFHKNDYLGALKYYQKALELAPESAKGHLEKQIKVLQYKSGKK